MEEGEKQGLQEGVYKDVENMYIILRWEVGGREESSDAGGAEERKYGVETRQRVLEVGRSQAIPWVLFSDKLLRKALYSASSYFHSEK